MTARMDGERPDPYDFPAPETDAGTVPNLRFPFADAHNRVLSGGWAREVTTRELPVATEMAGVNMRLKPGAIRELHWHKEAEWAYMIAGSVRITLLDEQGRMFVDDLGVGDLWYFPPGLPHSIQALADGCEFLLVFDDGGFSENETFLITDWLNHTPREVLAKNFGVAAEAFANLPTDIDHSRYMFEAAVPGADPELPPTPAGPTPVSYSYRLHEQEPTRVSGGEVRIADSSNFPVSTAIAAALASGGRARTFDYGAGDVGYVPFAMGHYVENTGAEPLRFLEMFRSDRFADVSLSQWMGSLPPALVKAHLNLDDATIAGLPREKPIIVEGSGA